MIRQAVISAGGFGTRLRPYTDTAPKPMIPIFGKPLLQWHVERFKKFGVDDFFFTLHYLPQVVMDYFGDGSKFGVSIRYAVEDEPLGTGGGLKKLERLLDDEFFLTNGDVFSLVDYGKMEEAWRAKSSSAIGMQRVGRAEHYEDADIAVVDDQGKIAEIHARPHGGRRYEGAHRMRGVSILKKKILLYAPATDFFQVNTDLLPAAIAAKELFYGYVCDDYSKGIDTIEKWKEVESYLLSLQSPAPGTA